MKKALAILLTLAMLFAVLAINTSANTVAPTITVFGNESTPVDAAGEVKFTVRLANFGTVQGLDLKITADNDITFTAVEADEIELVKYSNYTLKNQEIHIVDVTGNIANANDLTVANITVTATVNGDSVINVIGSLAKDGTTLFNNDEYGINGGKVIIKKVTEATVTESTNLEAEENFFIPYGAVVKSDGTFVPKKNDGGFDVAEGDTYTKVAVPASGITTFAWSKAKTDDSNAVRFGNYAKITENTTYGTMVICGDWDAFQQYYQAEKGYSAADLIKKISDSYDANIGENDYVYFVANGIQIDVYKVSQYNYMWKDSNSLEYAVRVNGLEADDKCAAVAYAITGSGPAKFSTEIKTYVHTQG